MARYAVRVVGSGRSWFVLARIPGDESAYRKGPMSEAAALAIAQDLTVQLQEMEAEEQAQRQSTAEDAEADAARKSDAKFERRMILSAAAAIIGYALYRLLV